MCMEKKYNEKKKQYNAEYQRKNMKQITIMLNRNTDKDMIDFIDKQEHKQQFFKKLIKKAMK